VFGDTALGISRITSIEGVISTPQDVDVVTHS
jgi:hypothetical protein